MELNKVKGHPKAYQQTLRMDPVGFCSVPPDKHKAKTG